MRRAGAVGAALAALVLVGCGSDDRSEPPSPAELAPADSSLYAEAVLRPEGEDREALETSLSLLLDTDDPGGEIVDELNQSIAEDDSEVTYQGDIEPWLGERGAVFLTELFPGEDAAPALGDDGERGAIIVEATDADAADAFIAKAAEEEEGEAERASYEGVQYTLFGEDPTAAGVVGEYLVLGDEETFQEVVDTEAGGSALADDAEFREALPEAGDSAASLYADAPAIVEAADAAGELDRSDREALDTVFAGIAEEPATAVVEAEANGFALDLSYGSVELPFLGAAEESALLRELPEDAWFAAGFKDVGDAVGSFIRRAEDFGVADGKLERAQRRFETDFGLEFDDAPLGDAAVFATGRGVFGAGGGLIVETDSRQAATEVLAGLRRQSERSGENVRPLAGAAGAEGFSVVLPEAPSTLNFVAAGDRLVIAYGDDATAAALEPEETLAASEEFGAATEALGDDFAVALFLDLAPITELLQLAAAADPSVEEVLPYLEAIDYLMVGSASEAGRDRQRLFLGLEEDVSGPAT